MEDGELGFADFEDPDLRRLVLRLLRAGYWATNPTTMEELAADLNLAEHASGPKAIRLIRKLEGAADLSATLEEIGRKVNADPGLKEVFEELKARGHDFD